MSDNKKNNLLTLIFLLVIALALGAIAYQNKTKRSAELISNNISLYPGDIKEIKTRLEDKEKLKFRYSVKDNSIITVDEEGHIKGLKPGKTEVKVKYPGAKLETVKIEVLKEPDLFFKNPKVLNLNKGTSAKLELSGKMTETAKIISQNTNIVKVVNGYAYAEDYGEVKIIATNSLGNKAEMTIVVESDRNLINKIECEDIKLKLGEEKKLEYEVFPKNAYKRLTFKSSKENIVIVDETGKVTALNEGKAKIEIRSHNGISKIVEVEVTSE